MKHIIFVIAFLFLPLQLFSQELVYDYGFDEPNNQKYVINNSTWDKTHLKYYIENTSSHLTAAQREHAIKTALARWTLVSSLTFEQVYSSTDADLIFGWRTGKHSGCYYAFDGVGNVLGHAKRPPYGIIHFDDAENWIASDSFSYGTNLMSVALHEIGHAVGIEHTPLKDALMYEDYQGKVWPEEDDIQAIWNLYGGSWQINGSSLFPDSCNFSITNLPNDPSISVKWSLSNNSHGILYHGNSPQCTVYKAIGNEMYKATLTAKIYGGNVLLTTLTKIISAYQGFKGNYSDGTAVNQMINYPNPIYTNCNGPLYISSPNFIGAMLTHQGGTPSYWHFDSNSGSLDIGMPDSGTQTIIIHAVCPKYGTYEIPIIRTGNHLLSINIESGILKISLTKEDEESIMKNGASMQTTESKSQNDITWVLEIYNARNGKRILKEEHHGNSYDIDTTGWEPGIYIVQVTIGKEVMSEKIIVK